MPPDEISMAVGRLDGRLSSVEGRQDRFEEAMQQHLGEINRKLDTLVEKSASRSGISDAAKLLLTLLLGASGWIAVLVHPKM